MGIFIDHREDDIVTISHLVDVSVEYFNTENERQGNPVGIVIQSRDEFGSISDVGDRILREFLYPTALQRVATLLVLANAFPLFSLQRDRKPLMHIQERKKFLSRFTCFLVQASLSTMTIDREDGQSYSISWKGFPDAYFQEQFLTYLYWIDTAKALTANENEKKQKEKDDTKILAHLALGCSMALESCVSVKIVLPPAPKEISF